MNTIEMIPSVTTFIEWANNELGELNLTDVEAGMLLGYIGGHGYGVSLDATNTVLLIDTEEPENGIIARGFGELIERISTWNYEFLQDSEVVGVHREEILRDLEMIDDILDRTGSRDGHSIGYPTVKELIEVLSKLPEDYRVTCCGAENFLYLFANQKCITIDNERCLC